MTEARKQTFLHTLKTLKYTEKAAKFLNDCLARPAASAPAPPPASAADSSASTGTYYKVVDGVKYDRALLEKAEGFAADGQISYPEAMGLWTSAQDGTGVTEIEKLTLQYTLRNLKYTDKAGKFMSECLAGGEAAKPTSFYKQIGGVKYDRGLLDKADDFAKDGQISYPEAKGLWDDAQDGSRVTETEKLTLQYIMNNYKITTKGANFLNECLGRSAKSGPSESYYRQIDGVKYDREILDIAKECSKDGRVSFDDANKLWAAALDGNGVTDTEKRTIQYVMKNFTCTEKAVNFLKSKLAM